MKIAAVLTVVVVFATAGSLADRRIRRDIINCPEKFIETRGTLILSSPKNQSMGRLDFQGVSINKIIINGSLSGLEPGKYIGVVHDTPYNDGTCNSTGVTLMSSDEDNYAEYDNGSPWVIFEAEQIVDKEELNITAKDGLRLSGPYANTLSGQFIVIHKEVADLQSLIKNSESGPTVACGLFNVDIPIAVSETPDDMISNRPSPEVNNGDEKVIANNNTEPTNLTVNNGDEKVISNNKKGPTESTVNNGDEKVNSNNNKEPTESTVNNGDEKVNSNNNKEPTESTVNNGDEKVNSNNNKEPTESTVNNGDEKVNSNNNKEPTESTVNNGDEKVNSNNNKEPTESTEPVVETTITDIPKDTGRSPDLNIPTIATCKQTDCDRESIEQIQTILKSIMYQITNHTQQLIDVMENYKKKLP